MQNNEQQIEFWNGEAGEKWVTQQQIMDATLQPVSDALLASANAQSGKPLWMWAVVAVTLAWHWRNRA